MDSKGFVDLLKRKGYDFVSGVPCTWLKNVITLISADSKIQYVGAPSEAAAVGIAAGAYLGGKTPAVLMQNNGLANCLDVVSSLMLVTWRGFRGEDFEEHLAVGKATRGVLKSFGVPVFAPEVDAVEKHLKVASFTSKMGKGPAVLLLRKGVIK